MSTSVSVKIEGDLGNIRVHDLAEHICKQVSTALSEAEAKYPGVSLSLGTAVEQKGALRQRNLLGSEPFKDYGEDHSVSFSSYIHLPAPTE